MGNGREKDGLGATPRGGSIPTGETNVSAEDMLTDPRMEYQDPLPPALQITDIPTRPHDPIDLSDEAEDPTITGGAVFEARSAQVVEVDDPRPTAPSTELAAASRPRHDEATAAIDLPPRPSAAMPAARASAPERSEPPSEDWDHPEPTRSTDEANPEASPRRASSKGTAGFVDAPPRDPTEPKSLPGHPVHEAAPFNIDEETFGPNEPMPAGSQLAFGVYRVDSLIGEGRRTRVYRATDMRSETLVALKEFKEPGNVLRMPHLRSLLQRYRQKEAQPALLNHEGAIELFDFFDDTTRGPIAVMEYVPAGDLESFLAHRGTPLRTKEAARLFIRICDVLSHALDYGVVHGDIQPRNILLTAQAQPKLDLVMPMLAGGPVPNPESDFAPPEVQGGRTAGPQADVYGIGASLYQASTHPKVAAEGGEGPPELEPIIARCVEDDPGARFASPRDLGDALRTVAGGALEPNGVPRWLQVAIGAAAIAFGLTVGFVVAPTEDEGRATGADVVSDMKREVLEHAQGLESKGQILRAAVMYRRLMRSNPELAEPKARYEAILEHPEFRPSLKRLRRRLLVDDIVDEAQLREDIELLSVLAPRDALVDHWRSRLNRSNDKGTTGGPVE